MSDIDRLEDRSLTHPQRSLASLPDPPPGSPPASYAIDQDELQRLHTELARLQNDLLRQQEESAMSSESGPADDDQRL
jgi:hypothetical protein